MFQKEVEVALTKHIKSIFIALLCSALFVGTSPAFEQPQLNYELKPRATHAEFGKPYFVDYFVTNNSNNPIVLCNCQISGEIIFGKLGQNNEAPLFLDKFKTTEAPKPSDFVTIPPHSTSKFSWGGFGKEYFSSPGEWLLKIRDSFTAANGPNGKSSWHGTIESPLLRIIVKDN